MNTDPWRILRECQSRSAHEQQLLSGRDWLLVSAIVEYLTALFPLYLWTVDYFVSARVGTDPISDKMRLACCAMLGVGTTFLVLSWWAKYAPFRASVIALLFYAGLQAWIMLTLPHHLMDGIASKIIIFLGLLMAVRTGYRRRHHA
ncbi:hypothetical protein [Geminisphaera colitermitum]|uniref:hypothetical protein n=1 Tax=Geminisphaera colitermitum TaxID=1148786 RepID=UPI0005B8B4C0|nr:hypothetical protein [Geminisphaera colitermitum]